MGTLNLVTEQVNDPTTRENFLKISEFLQKNPFWYGDFKEFTITFTKSGGETKIIPHRLGFKPNVVIQTFLEKYLDIAAGTITWNYDLFTNETISVTNSGVGVVKAIIGRMSNSGA